MSNTATHLEFSVRAAPDSPPPDLGRLRSRSNRITASTLNSSSSRRSSRRSSSRRSGGGGGGGGSSSSVRVKHELFAAPRSPNPSRAPVRQISLASEQVHKARGGDPTDGQTDGKGRVVCR